MPLLSANDMVAPLYLPLAPLLARRPGLPFRLEPRLPHRAPLADPAPLPHQRPAVEPGPGRGDGVEPLPVMCGDLPSKTGQPAIVRSFQPASDRLSLLPLNIVRIDIYAVLCSASILGSPINHIGEQP